MHQRLSFRILLGLLAFSAFSITASTKTDFDTKNYSPLSHTYTHDVLKNISTMRSSVGPLPFGVSHFIKGLQINQDNEGNITNVDFLLPLPFMVLNVGLDLKPNMDMEQNFGLNEDELSNIVRGNVILGDLYKYPFYVRVGYDYVPFGRHFSEAITPYRMVTKSIMENKGVVFSGGGAYKDSQGELKGSVTYNINNINRLIFVNSQYDHMQPYLGTIERSLVGGGIGMTDKKGDILFNCYSHINFSKSYNFLFEYVYNARVFLRPDWKKRVSEHTLHVEGSKHFSNMTIIRWDTSPTAIMGYEKGPKLLQESPITVSNLFVAGKLEFWKKRLTLLGGTRVDLTHGLQPFGRISLSL